MRPLRANFQRALDWRLMLAALLLWGGLAAIVTELAGGAAREHALSQVDNELHTQSQLRLESLARQVDRRRQQVRLLAKTLRSSASPGPRATRATMRWSRVRWRAGSAVWKAFSAPSPRPPPMSCRSA
ncbi:hypothetical protein I0E98_03215 [Pseudomonas lalucatii]|nr:hypothetical protein [Pseudomonas lalucatii]